MFLEASKRWLQYRLNLDTLLRYKKMELWLHGAGIMWVKQLCHKASVIWFQL